MNSITSSKPLITYFFIVFLLLIINITLTAQTDSSELKDFKIIIEKQDNKVIMKCEKGCAWINLTYQNNKVAQAIDEYGMTKLNESNTKESNLSDFLFTLTKTNHGISLKGIKGTAWRSLSFSLPEGQQQRIDQYGMTAEK